MKKVLLFILLVVSVFGADAQMDKKEFKRMFNEAFDSISGFCPKACPNYEHSLELFLKLNKEKPNDANIMANIGQCYINMNRTQTKAMGLPYLESVVVDESTETGLKEKNFNPYYTPRDVKEEKAPIEAIWWLGKAYHASDDFDNALKYLKKYKSFLDPNSSDGEEVFKMVSRDIEIAQNAKELKENPVTANIEELATEPSSNVNTEFPDYRPLPNADETILYFTSRRYGSTGNKRDADSSYFEDIYYTVKKDGVWQDAVPIGADVNGDEHEATVSLSPNGKKMYIYKFDDATDGDIYVIEHDGEKWSEPTPLLEGKVNTKYWESHATISLNEDLIIFSSERPVLDEKGNESDEYFGLELYSIEKGIDGEWGQPKRLGSNINTVYDENSPYLHPDGKTLYFSSKGHNTMGGYDVFKSELVNGEWSAPVNMGYPVNTVGDDVFFQPSLDGKRGYFSSFRDGGKGDQDIYIIELDDESDIAMIRGCVGNKTTEFLNQVDNFEFVVLLNGNELSRGGVDANTGLFSSILTTDVEYTFQYHINGNMIEEKFTAPSGQGYVEVNKTAMLNGSNIELAIVDAVSKESCFIQPPPPVEFDTLRIDNVHFVFDEVELIDSSIPELEKVFAYMEKYPESRISVEGHTDSRGSNSYNKRLSRRRAEEIKRIMVKRGVDPKRLDTKGMGEGYPIQPNENPDGSDNPEGRQENRRVEFVVLK